MALLPLFYNELDDLFFNRNRDLGRYILCAPRRQILRGPRDDSTVIKSDKNTFEVSLDVQQFSPEELTVKTVDDNCVVVEGKHEEKEDEHGFISRHFVRRYMLPKGHEVKDVQSSLSADGILTITSRKRKLTEANEREIPIKLTGPSKQPIENGMQNKENEEDKEEPKQKKAKK